MTISKHLWVCSCLLFICQLKLQNQRNAQSDQASSANYLQHIQDCIKSGENFKTNEGIKAHLENRKCIQMLQCKTLCNKTYPQNKASDYEASKQLFLIFSFSSIKKNKPNQGDKAVFSNSWYICTGTMKQDR